MSKVRLLKVLVQPVFVIDDGEALTEQHAQPVEVSAGEWPTFATGRFLDATKDLQAHLDAAEPKGPKK